MGEEKGERQSPLSGASHARVSQILSACDENTERRSRLM